MKRIKIAFTLIELLVVIAIIVILASILFPVLAHARAKARQSGCANNHAQCLRSFQLYMGDYNDRIVPVMYNSSGCGQSNPAWPMTLQPYVKNWHIFRCPGDVNALDDRLSFTNNESTNPADGIAKICAWAMRTNLGMNYVYLSPMIAGTGSNGIPRGTYKTNTASMARVGHPSSTIALVDSIWWRKPNGLPQGGGNWTVDPPCEKYQGQSTFPTPNPISVWYSLGWYLNGARGQDLWMEYGGVWPWHGDPNRPEAISSRAGVAFLDGHVRHLNLDQITAGCDLRPKLGGNITDIDSYQWDIE